MTLSDSQLQAVSSARPLGLYVHVPFCLRRCRYCDFSSNVYQAHSARSFVEAVLTELAYWSTRLDLSDVTNVFIGGGTPTVLGDELARLIAGLAGHIAVSRLTEFTVEANPATIEQPAAQRLCQAGVSRLSLGAQSFCDDELATLGRLHSVEQIGQSVAVARAAGCDNINLDLMYGLPGQTLDSWRASVAAAVELGIEHMSCYALSYEPGTELKALADAGAIRPLPDELTVAMYEAVQRDLAEAGFEHYEISNWSQPGRQCRHNLLYWRNQPWLGIGPSAASFLGGVRFRGVSGLAEWSSGAMRGEPVLDDVEQLTGLAAVGEAIMLALRLREGVDVEAFALRYGIDVRTQFAEVIARHVEAGLLCWSAGRLRLTRQSLPVADSVLADFIEC